jgi:hypothetical protein
MDVGSLEDFADLAAVTAPLPVHLPKRGGGGARANESY